MRKPRENYQEVIASKAEKLGLLMRKAGKGRRNVVWDSEGRKIECFYVKIDLFQSYSIVILSLVLVHNRFETILKG